MRDVGAGPAVLLFHGAPSSAEYFDPLVCDLARDHRVLLPDLPGYGRTPPLEGTYDLVRVQRLVEDQLRAHGIRECAVVGQSLGGYRALALALGGNVRTTHVVLLGGFAHLDDGTRAKLAGNRDAARQRVDLKPVAASLVLSPASLARRPEIAAQVAAWLDVASPDVVADELDALLSAADLRPGLADFGAPILVLAGADDAIIPPTLSEGVARAGRHVTVDILADCGHALLLENPEHAVALIGNFLRSSGSA